MCVAQARGVARQACHAVAASVELKLQRLDGGIVALLGILVFSFLILFILLVGLGIVSILVFCILFDLLKQSELLLGETEAIPCLGVEEHYIGVALGAPAAVAAVAGAVALPYHGLAVEHPLGVAVGIAALGEVGDLA